MAATEKKIADLVAFTTPADGDLLASVDVSDTSQSDDGSTKKITRANFLGTLFSIAADTGDDLDILPAKTFSILGGTGIASVASATRKITLNIDATVATLTGTQTFTNKTINGDDNTLSNIAYDSIKSTSRTGNDVKLVTGTKGAAYEDGVWDSNGDMVGLLSLVGAGNGVTDDTTTINAFLTANAGKAVRIPAGDYLVTGTIAIPANTTVYAYGARIFDNITHRTLVTMLSNSRLFGMEIDGAASATYDADGKGLSITGTDGSEVYDVIVKDVYIHDIGNYGIVCDYAERVNIENVRIEDIGYCGIMILSSWYINIDRAYIDTITPGSAGNCYGVAFTAFDDAAYRITRYCTITNSVVANSTVWEGIDTHGGYNIRIENNFIYGCAVGIVLKMIPSAGTARSAASHCIVKGNTVYGGGNIGCYINGTTDLYARSNIISDNVFYECGEEGGDAIDTGAINLGYTYNTVISNNMIDKPYGSGIINKRNNYGFVITGNLIRDAQNSVANQTVGIYNYVDNVGIISGNQLYYVEAGLNTDVAQIGIYIGGDVENNVTLGPNANNYQTLITMADERVNYGHLTKPRARAYSAVNQLNLVDSTPTQVALGTENYDIGTNFASSTFTAPIDGYYRCSGQIMFSNVIADKLYVGQIYKNAASISDDYKHSALAQSLACKPSVTDYLSAGDTIKLYATSYADADTVDITLGTKYTFLEVEFIGD